MEQYSSRLGTKESISLRQKLSKRHRNQAKLGIARKANPKPIFMGRQPKRQARAESHPRQDPQAIHYIIRNRHNGSKKQTSRARKAKTRNLLDRSQEVYQKLVRPGSIQIAQERGFRRSGLSYSKQKRIIEKTRLEKIRSEQIRLEKNPAMGMNLDMLRARNFQTVGAPGFRPKRDHSEYILRAVNTPKKKKSICTPQEITFRKRDWRLKRTSQERMELHGQKNIIVNGERPRNLSYGPGSNPNQNKKAGRANKVNKANKANKANKKTKPKANISQQRINRSNREIQKIENGSFRNDSQNTAKNSASSIYYSRGPNKNFTTKLAKKPRLSQLATSSRNVDNSKRNRSFNRRRSNISKRLPSTQSSKPSKPYKGKVVPLIGTTVSQRQHPRPKSKSKPRNKPQHKAQIINNNNHNANNSNTNNNNQSNSHKNNKISSKINNHQNRPQPGPAKKPKSSRHNLKVLDSKEVKIHKKVSRKSRQKMNRTYKDFMSLEESLPKDTQIHENQSEVNHFSCQGSNFLNWSNTSHFKIGSEFQTSSVKIKNPSYLKLGVKILRLFFREKTISAKSHFIQILKEWKKGKSKRSQNSSDGLSPCDIQKCVNQIIDSFSKTQCTFLYYFVSFD